MEDIITVSVVNFRTIWGEKEVNLNRIKGYIKAAKAKGTHLILFPEMALTGYDNEKEVPFAEKMQVRLAETVPGPATEEIAQLAKECSIYVVFGMPEKDGDKVYNTAVVCTSEGEILKYRKMHLPEDEPDWASRGQDPLVFDTPWGPIGMSICYDVYAFPELARYTSAKGGRLYLNPTACCESAVPGRMVQTQLESMAITNPLFIASANLAGYDKTHYFIGGSSIMGPASNIGDVHYYAGHPFFTEDSDSQDMYTATIDLTMATYNTFTHLFQYNERIGDTDWRPDVYAKMYQEIADSEEWQKKRSGQ